MTDSDIITEEHCGWCPGGWCPRCAPADQCGHYPFCADRCPQEWYMDERLLEGHTDPEIVATI